MRVCPREHQAVLLHAISLVSMKLCQFKGSTPKLKQANWFPVLVLSGGRIDHLLVSLVFTGEIALKWAKCMKLSLRCNKI